MSEIKSEPSLPSIRFLDQVVIPSRETLWFGVYRYTLSEIEVTLPDGQKIIVYRSEPIFDDSSREFREQNLPDLGQEIRTLSEEFSKLPPKEQEKLRATYQETRRKFPSGKYNPLFEQEELKGQFKRRKQEIEEEKK